MSFADKDHPVWNIAKLLVIGGLGLGVMLVAGESGWELLVPFVAALAGGKFVSQDAFKRKESQ